MSKSKKPELILDICTQPYAEWCAENSRPVLEHRRRDGVVLKIVIERISKNFRSTLRAMKDAHNNNWISQCGMRLLVTSGQMSITTDIFWLPRSNLHTARKCAVFISAGMAEKVASRIKLTLAEFSHMCNIEHEIRIGKAAL